MKKPVTKKTPDVVIAIPAKGAVKGAAKGAVKGAAKGAAKAAMKGGY